MYFLFIIFYFDNLMAVGLHLNYHKTTSNEWNIYHYSVYNMFKRTIFLLKEMEYSLPQNE